MNDDDKPKLPNDANELIDLGHCESTGAHHVLACKDGVPVGAGHMSPVDDGKPLPADCDLYYVDPKTGRVLDSVRIGKGPSQVASPQYRENYDRIFGSKDDKGLN